MPEVGSCRRGGGPSKLALLRIFRSSFEVRGWAALRIAGSFRCRLGIGRETTLLFLRGGIRFDRTTNGAAEKSAKQSQFSHRRHFCLPVLSSAWRELAWFVIFSGAREFSFVDDSLRPSVHWRQQHNEKLYIEIGRAYASYPTASVLATAHRCSRRIHVRWPVVIKADIQPAVGQAGRLPRTVFTIPLTLLSIAGVLPADPVAEGRDIYNRSCTTCHGLDATAGDRAPALAAQRDYLRTGEQEIFDAIRNGIPGSLMPPANLPEVDIRKVVAYIRSLRAPASEAPVSGNVARGEEIFRGKGRCLDCHMLGGKGGLLGPDLSNIGGERGLGPIRDALTKTRPNNAPGYRAASLITAEGKKLAGVVKNENNFSLQFLDADGRLHLFTRDEVREITYREQSLMPADYGQKLRPSEMQDLLAFLSRLKEPK